MGEACSRAGIAVTGRGRRPIQASVRTREGGEGDALAEAFRGALSQWASGVAILAVSDGEEIDAITVSSFCSLSADPPLVLASVGEQASILPMIREVGRFTISILAEDQQRVAGAIAQRFPGSGDAFQSLEDPSVGGALAALDCTLWKEYPGGDHRIVVGSVASISFGTEEKPLLYFRREYRGLR